MREVPDGVVVRARLTPRCTDCGKTIRSMRETHRKVPRCDRCEVRQAISEYGEEYRGRKKDGIEA